MHIHSFCVRELANMCADRNVKIVRTAIARRTTAIKILIMPKNWLCMLGVCMCVCAMCMCSILFFRAFRIKKKNGCTSIRPCVILKSLCIQHDGTENPSFHNNNTFNVATYDYSQFKPSSITRGYIECHCERMYVVCVVYVWDDELKWKPQVPRINYLRHLERYYSYQIDKYPYWLCIPYQTIFKWASDGNSNAIRTSLPL